MGERTSQRGPLTGTSAGQSRGPVDPDSDSIILRNRGPLGTDNFSMIAAPIVFKAIEIDYAKAYHFFYVCAFHVKYAEKTKYDSNWFSPDDIDIPSGSEIKKDVVALAGKIYVEYFNALSKSLEKAEQIKMDWYQQQENAKKSIQAKFNRLHSDRESVINETGNIIVFLALVEFTSTVVVKLVKNFAGPFGGVVDIAYESSVEGIDTYHGPKSQNPKANKAQESFKAVVGKVKSEGEKEIAEKINKDGVEAIFKNRERANKQLIEQQKKLGKKLAKDLDIKKAAQSKRVNPKKIKKFGKELGNLAKQHAGVEKKIKDMSNKKWWTGKGKLQNLKHSTKGNVLNIIFIADDIISAYEKLEKRIETQR